MPEQTKYTIQYFDIPIKELIKIQLPYGAMIFDLRYNNGFIQLFIACNPNNTMEEKELKILTHESTFSEGHLKYIGTVSIFEGGPAYHVFENIESEMSKSEKESRG